MDKIKFFKKVFQNNDDLLGCFVELSNGKFIRLKEIVKRYEMLNEEEPKEWITMKGNHIPIKEGETKEEAVKKFLKDKNKKGLDKTEKSDYNISKGKQQFSKYASERDEKGVTPEKIVNRLNNFKTSDGRVWSSNQIKSIIKDVQKRVNSIKKDSASTYRIGEGKRNKAVYTPERMEEHRKIMADIFGDAANKKPEKGEKPTFIFLGGRGGSGKSKFNKQVYDKDKFVVIDADYIKEHLPGYEGWNAAYYHEESADLVEKALLLAKQQGLNVVLDATMNGLESSKRRLQWFIDAGYRTEAHYMFLPRQKSAERAIGRFLGEKNGRYVPLDKILDMTENEKNFDEIKEMVDGWSFSNNDVGRNEPPKLVAKSGKFSYKEGGPVWQKK